MKKPKFFDGEIYHIFNRGVEKRNIFQNQADYERFVFILEHFNTTDPAGFTKREVGLLEVKPPTNEKKLVNIFAFSLMPNHFHLVLEQKRGGGVSKFLQKISTGYTMYFNKLNNRVGSLFQNTYKAVPVVRDAQFNYIPHYVHKNPIDVAPKNADLKDFLRNYKWSSYYDYISQEQRYPFVNRDFFLESFGGQKQYQKDFEEFLKTKDGRWAIEKIK